jgi:hypothetical protein
MPTTTPGIVVGCGGEESMRDKFLAFLNGAKRKGENSRKYLSRAFSEETKILSTNLNGCSLPT